MENERKKKIFYKTMKNMSYNINEFLKTSRQYNLFRLLNSNIRISEKFLIKNNSFQNYENNNNAQLNTLTNRKLKSSQSSILKNPNIMNRAELSAFYIKNALLDSEKNYLINKKKFETIREKTDKINKYIISLRKKEKKEEAKNININKSQDYIKEKQNIKIYNLLKENPLLIKRKKDIESYYISKDEKQISKDNKKIRYMNKIKEYLELLKIKHDKLLDNKEKIIKIRKTKYITNYNNRLQQEYLRDTKKLLEEIKKDKQISLKNIKETNCTLNIINCNKSFLDDDIKLKYNHNHNYKYNYTTKTNNKSNKSNILDNNNSFIMNNFHILRINKLEKRINNKNNSYICLTKKKQQI